MCESQAHMNSNIQNCSSDLYKPSSALHFRVFLYTRTYMFKHVTITMAVTKEQEEALSIHKRW